MIRRDKNHARAKTGGDDADVFNGTVGEHGFEIVFGGRIKNSEQRGNRPDDERDQTRPGVGRRQEIGIDAQNSVEAEIQSCARQHGNKRAGAAV